MTPQKNPQKNPQKIQNNQEGSKFKKFGNALINENFCNLFYLKNQENLFRKFTNLIMRDGKKTKASKILFEMLLILKKRTNISDNDKNMVLSLDKKNTSLNLKSNHLENLINSQLFLLISQAIENVTPSLEVRKVRVKGSTYLVPAVLKKKKQETLALKWLIESAKKRKKNSKFNFSICLADEIFDASRKLGHARQKRDELHRLAQMNRAYIRYKWW